MTDLAERSKNEKCQLILGNCLEKIKEIPNNSIDLVLTDSPYGIDFQSVWRIESKRFQKIQGDKKVFGDWIPECYRILKNGCAFYMFSRWDVYPKWIELIKRAGFKVKSLVVWDRVVHGLGDLNGAYAPCYDFCVFSVKGRHLLRHGRPKDIIRVKRVNAEKLVHPTEKPLTLIEKFLINSSDIGNTVFDPFMGSGTTGVTALKLGRRFVGIEINPKYFEIAKQRIEPWLKQQRLGVLQNV